MLRFLRQRPSHVLCTPQGAVGSVATVRKCAFQVSAKTLEQVCGRGRHRPCLTREQHAVSSFSGQDSELKIPWGRSTANSTEQGKLGYLLFLRNHLRSSCPVRARTAGLGLWLPTALTDDRPRCGVRGQRRDGIRRNRKRWPRMGKKRRMVRQSDSPETDSQGAAVPAHKVSVTLKLAL